MPQLTHPLPQVIRREPVPLGLGAVPRAGAGRGAAVPPGGLAGGCGAIGSVPVASVVLGGRGVAVAVAMAVVVGGAVA